MSEGVVNAGYFPEYMKSGEINIKDPDGYHIAVGHWGQAEHDVWLQRIQDNSQADGGRL